MNTNHNKLALRKQSIRTLTAGELSVALGGQQGNTTTNTGTTNQSTCHGCAPTTGQTIRRTQL